jgi:hypothetical protein
MKTKFTLTNIVLALLALSTLNPQYSTVFAQGTAFTYQGQLQNNGSPASGTFNLTFTLFNTNSIGVPVAGPLTNNTVVITNGLFTVLIDFGPGAFTGQTNWLQIGVETNGASPFTTLAPRQQLTPTPYAIYAEGVAASGISGTLTNGQLAHSAVTVDAGPGFSGGGKVTLGNSITLTNTGVLSITGNADITAATVGGAVTLGDTATSADTPSTLVKRDGSGNFSAGSVTLAGTLTFPDVALTPVIINSGSTLLMSVDTNYDLFLGLGAGPGESGSGNTGVGLDALNLAIGSDNTAVGLQTLLNNNGGSYNTAVGAFALQLNMSGGGNTANGYVALFDNTSGSANTAIGSGAMLNNTTGSYNTAIGDNALFSNTNGLGNTASGYQALYSNTGDTFGDGSYNTADGYEALYLNTLGLYNTASGYQALYSNASGSENTANGSQALFLNTSGNYNTANGGEALDNNTSGSDNTANGFQTLFSNTTGNNNSANGAYALSSNTNGSGNTANGYHALYLNTDGSDNTANGRAALYNNRDGIENTAEGVQALNSNTNGAYNTANGYQALYSNTGGFLTGFGNTADGYQALYANTTGTANIALGYAAGYNVTTGSANIEIGNAGKASDSGVIRIGTNGNQTATFIAGISGTTVSGSAVIVNASGQLGVAPSSQRFKQDIHSMDDESSVLMALRPVTFKYKPDIDPQGTPQFGLVAEEVAKVDSDLVVRDGKGQIFTVRYDAVNAMLLNEFLKEHRTVEEQSGEIQNLKHQNDSLEKRLNELEKAVARIAEKSGTTLALNSKATENK